MPVSVRLKSTSNSRSKRVSEIIHRAEKQLLQDRIKCINGILWDSEGKLDRSRSRLLLLVTTTTIKDSCIEFINNVREARFIKMQNRQVNKFNRLVIKSNTDRDGEASAQNRNISNQLQIANNNNNQWQGSGGSNRWVINLSDTPLTPAQESLLSKGPNYAIAPKNPPNVDYIATIETVCQKLTDQDAEKLRADINRLLRKAQAPKPNLTIE